MKLQEFFFRVSRNGCNSNKATALRHVFCYIYYIKLVLNNYIFSLENISVNNTYVNNTYVNNTSVINTCFFINFLTSYRVVRAL